MKKILLAFLASALILTTAGCGGGDNKDSSETSGKKKVTQVAYEAPEEEDTTKEAIEYLKNQLPLYSKYLEIRRGIPLTFETETTTPEGHEIAGLYIRDDSSIAIRSTDDDGNKLTTIYMDSKFYIVSDKDKTIYSVTYPKDEIQEIVENNRLKIRLSDAQLFTYEAKATDYKDVAYNSELIYTTSDTPAEYYFDKATDELKYIVTGNTEIKILAINNTVTDEVFTLPEDYANATVNEYMEKLEAEAAQTATAEAAPAE